MSTPTIPKPTILVIPGSFLLISSYAAVIAELKARGYPVHGIELETVGRRPDGDKVPDMYDDAAKVAALAARLADEGNEVVLVAHSYGGIVAGQASSGLAKSVRASQGKKGGIIRIVFVSAVAPREGQTVKDLIDGVLDFLTIKASADGYIVKMDDAVCAAGAFSDLPAEEALVLASQTADHSAASFVQPLTYGAHKDIPVSFLLCENDKLMAPALQDKIIAGMESEMGGRTVDRYVVKSDHAIHASQPKTMADVVMKALGH
ncbi:Alpha/beta hydrolase fold-1 [Mycena galopus ATCC 62051]|nr:Alpha/beta hydrolase fold-1 [Mycena galopus ATCC 62051]